MWPFEHHDNGKVFLHKENWQNFKNYKDSGAEYPHNWLHRRLFMLIHSPHNTIDEIPLLNEDEHPLFGNIRYNQSRIINCVSKDWSVIYDVYPAWHRTIYDAEGLSPSYHLWLEDKHPQPTYGEPVVLFTTNVTLTYQPNENIFAQFRGKYWLVDRFKDFGLGVNKPTLTEIQSIGTKKKLYRSIDD